MQHAPIDSYFLGLRRYIPEHNTVHLILVLYQKNHLHVRYCPYLTPSLVQCAVCLLAYVASTNQPRLLT